MIRWVSGDFWESLNEVDAIVNTVNTVGVMGKGLALQFRERFPDNYTFYRRACQAGQVQIGKMLVYPTNRLTPRFIINFPTKKHWRQPSRLEYIESGLQDLVRVIRENEIHSIAIPALGCGLGGLKWHDVKNLINRYLETLKNVEVRVYEPAETTLALAPEEAVFLKVLDTYSELHGPVGLSEVKLIAEISGVLDALSEPVESLLKRLISKGLMATAQLGSQRLYGVASEQARTLIEKTLSQFPEWNEQAEELVQKLGSIDSLAGLQAVSAVERLRGHKDTLKYLHKAILEAQT